MCAVANHHAQYTLPPARTTRKVGSTMIGQARQNVTRVTNRVSPGPRRANAWLARKRIVSAGRRARVTISFPVANVGGNLATLAAVVAGNRYELGEVTGRRLESIALRAASVIAVFRSLSRPRVIQ